MDKLTTRDFTDWHTAISSSDGNDYDTALAHIYVHLSAMNHGYGLYNTKFFSHVTRNIPRHIMDKAWRVYKDLLGCEMLVTPEHLAKIFKPVHIDKPVKGFFSRDINEVVSDDCSNCSRDYPHITKQTAVDWFVCYD